ncbi:hypothetical protein EV363DRAFT_1405268 [Boletus edulis]|nr:hypothetical protein EV363DRAFT_1405268 [Boletus edulis]
MAEAKTANMIEWAQGQMIYEMTERVERAEVWPRHGQPSRVGPGPENVFDYRKDREGPSMAKRGPKHGRGKEGRHIRGPSMAKARRADIFEWAQGQRIYELTERIERAQAREGPGMVKARTAEVIERANGERIYRMTKMIERAQAWPRQGGPRPKIKWGPYFRELLYGSINHDEALTRPRLIYTEDLEGQDDLQDDRGGLGPAPRFRGGPIGEGLLDGPIHTVRPWQVQTGICQRDFQMIQGTTEVIAEAMYTWNLNVKDGRMIMTQRGTAVNIHKCF